MLKRMATLALLDSLCWGAFADTVQQNTSFALLGEPKYPEGFTHFGYVNPDAPKGGSIKLSALGTYDNFNRFALRGVAAERTERLYDTLFTSSDDEPGSFYPLIALHARHADDFRWMEVELNPKATFHDGSPILDSDVAFTFNMFMTQGVPQFRVMYKGVKVTAIGPRTVRLEMPKPDKERLMGLLTLPVMPESFCKKS